MRAFIGILSVILLMSFVGSSFAQDPGTPDTLIIGDDGVVYSYFGNKVKIPVYVWSDNEMQVVAIGLEYGFDTQVLTLDSVSTQYSILNEGYFDMGLVVEDESIDGVMTDSLGIAAISIFNPAPAGRYKVCDIWLDGAGIGEQLTIDTCLIGVGFNNTFQPYGTGYYTPQFVSGIFDIVEGPSIIYLDKPDQVSGPSGIEMNFEISATGYFPPISIYLDSLVRQDEDKLPQNAPTTIGMNPLTFQWLPNPYEGNSRWIAYFTTVDAIDYDEQFSVDIHVTGEGPYWGVIGDANCDEVVDIDDIVFLIDYVFNGGPMPLCE